MLISFSSLAELNGDGYYRVCNAITKRYAYLLDNKGSFDAATTSADVNALKLYSGFEKASSDPSTIFYLNKISGTGSNLDHNVSGQGTSLYQFLETYLKVLDSRRVIDGDKAYYAYATKSKFTKYLGDLGGNEGEEGYPSVDAQGDCRLWHIKPVKADQDDSYFGIIPSVSAGGKYYQPFFAAFPFNASSAGVKFYAVAKVDAGLGVVVFRQLDGVVPAGTPVIVECAATTASGNRLNIGPSGSAANVSGNRLKGVYFNNVYPPQHRNVTPFNKTTMRCLAMENGKLVFAKANHDYVPRNEAYLELSGAETAIGTYQIMMEPDYNAYVAELLKQNPDGYYRMQNAGTGRFAYMVDSKGDFATSDLRSLRLFSGALKASSDPASVFYMERPKDTDDVRLHNLYSQGTNTLESLKSYLALEKGGESDGSATYYAKSTSGRYLGDSHPAASDLEGYASVNATLDNCLWHFKPLSETSDNHFGIAPTVTADGKYYYPFYAAFPVKAYSDGMKFYAVTNVDANLGIMVVSELTGVIPAGTPVIVECSHPLAADNRLVVGAAGQAANVAGNLLSGVYFDNTASGHNNATSYDKSSMRSLASVDGKLVFTPAESQYVARNQAFMRLAGDVQKRVTTYQVMTLEDYNDYLASLGESLPDGYYRLRNASTKRYAYLNGAKGNLVGDGTPDVSAFHLCSDLLRMQSDPASVIGVTARSVAGSMVDKDIRMQGTTFTRLFSAYPKVSPSETVDGKQAFNVYAQGNGRVRYLTDDASGDWMTAGDLGSAANWWFEAVDAGSDSDWFGVVPTVTVGGKYYGTLMADFPVAAQSEGVKFHKISNVYGNKGVAIIEQIDGTVPAGTPVIVECAGPLASDNKLIVGATDNMAQVRGNRLAGVWSDCTESAHFSATAFDADAMRVLSADGNGITFAKAQFEYVPRNQAYLPLSGSMQTGVDTYLVMTDEEFRNWSGVDGVIAEDDPVDVYKIDGTLVRSGIGRKDVSSLGSGVYIVRAGGVAEKVIVR